MHLTSIRDGVLVLFVLFAGSSAIAGDFTYKGQLDSSVTWDQHGATFGSAPLNIRHEAHPNFVTDVNIESWSSSGGSPQLHNDVQMSFSMGSWFSAKALAYSSVVVSDSITVNSASVLSGTMEITWGIEGRLHRNMISASGGTVKRALWARGELYANVGAAGPLEVLFSETLEHGVIPNNFNGYSDFLDVDSDIPYGFVGGTNYPENKNFNYSVTEQTIRFAFLPNQPNFMQVGLDSVTNAAFRNWDMGEFNAELDASFGNTATMLGVRVFDQNGALVPTSEYSISSSSGYDYPALLPEPASLSLIGLTGLALLRRRNTHCNSNV